MELVLSLHSQCNGIIDIPILDKFKHFVCTNDAVTLDNSRITESGDVRITESGDVRITESEETPQSVTPTAPTNLTAVTKSDNKIDLSWNTPVDNGGSPLIGYDLIYSKNSDFSDSITVNLGLVNSHSIIQLDPDTQYFFKVQAKNSLHTGAESSVTNTTTSNIIFGESTVDLTIPEGDTITIGSEEYQNITNNGTLIVTGGIIRCESYTEGENGKIIVEKTGCLGGDAGQTIAGTKGTDPYSGIRYIPRPEAPQVPPTNGQLIAPGIAAACTDLNNISRIIDDSLDVDSFETQFINNIIGGKGSDGTVASPSGNGGAAGARVEKIDSPFLVLIAAAADGGDGGLAAQGTGGVRGGGKIALYIRTITTKITIESVGNDGNNGNKGTAEPGGLGGTEINCHLSDCSTPGQNGTAASANGTLGSKGSQGGLVILVYESISDVDDISVDVSGGLGGFNGEVASSTNELTTTRADSGEDGVFVSRTYQELLDSQ